MLPQAGRGTDVRGVAEGPQTGPASSRSAFRFLGADLLVGARR